MFIDLMFDLILSFFESFFVDWKKKKKKGEEEEVEGKENEKRRRINRTRG
jgi:hypothetical protein